MPTPVQWQSRVSFRGPTLTPHKVAVQAGGANDDTQPETSIGKHRILTFRLEENEVQEEQCADEQTESP